MRGGGCKRSLSTDDGRSTMVPDKHESWWYYQVLPEVADQEWQRKDNKHEQDYTVQSTPVTVPQKKLAVITYDNL